MKSLQCNQPKGHAHTLYNQYTVYSRYTLEPILYCESSLVSFEQCFQIKVYKSISTFDVSDCSINFIFLVKKMILLCTLNSINFLWVHFFNLKILIINNEIKRCIYWMYHVIIFAMAKNCMQNVVLKIPKFRLWL